MNDRHDSYHKTVAAQADTKKRSTDANLLCAKHV